MDRAHFLWDPVEDNIVKEIDDSGTTIADYTTEPYLYGDLVSQHRDGQSSFYHYDGQGSTTSLTDSAGNVTDTYAYTAFGEITAQTGSTVNSFQYVGQKGYFGATQTREYSVRDRPYDASKARWLTVDVLVQFQDSNVFAYSRNQPLSLVDPSGREAEPLSCCACCVNSVEITAVKEGPVGSFRAARTMVTLEGHFFNVTIGLKLFPSKVHLPCALYWGEYTTRLPNPNPYGLELKKWANLYKTMPPLDVPNEETRKRLLEGPGLYPFRYHNCQHVTGKLKCEEKGTLYIVQIIDNPALQSHSVTNVRGVPVFATPNTFDRMLSFFISIQSSTDTRCSEKSKFVRAQQYLELKDGKLIKASFKTDSDDIVHADTWPGDPKEVDHVTFPTNWPPRDNC